MERCVCETGSRDCLYIGGVMCRSLFFAMFVSGLFAFFFSASAFADVAPTCGGGGEGRFYYPCHDNPYHLTKNGCIDVCQNSDYCKPYQVEGKTVFGGFARISDVEWYNVEDCEKACNYEKEKCDENDQNCLRPFMPDIINCESLTDEFDQKWCNEHCVDSILTSECGRSCIKNGMEDGFLALSSGDLIFGKIEGLDCYYEAGYGNQYCYNLCTDDYYCSSIPLEYDTKWSVFGALMTLLSVLCGIILFVVNKKRKPEDED